MSLELLCTKWNYIFLSADASKYKTINIHRLHLSFVESYFLIKFMKNAIYLRILCRLRLTVQFKFPFCWRHWRSQNCISHQKKSRTIIEKLYFLSGYKISGKKQTIYRGNLRTTDWFLNILNHKKLKKQTFLDEPHLF